MRLYEFTTNLFEYSRDITKQKLGDRLIQAAQRDRKQDIDTILIGLENIDPTKNKQYVQWLANQYIKNQFRLEDANRVKEVLMNFEKLKPRLPQKDINRYTFYELDQTIDKILGVKLGDTGDNDQELSIPNVKVLYKGPLGQLAIPETEEASCQLGSGTKWCTSARNDNMFDEYNEEGPLYVWKDKTGKYQFHFPSFQFMDARNEPLTPEKIKEFRTQNPVTKKLFAKEEAKIIKDPSSAGVYACDVIKGRWPEAEPYIMKEPDAATNYAREVIKGRWPEAEPAIMKEPYIARVYAQYVIKGPWPEAEPYIMKEPYIARVYAQYVIKGPWPEAGIK